MIEVAYQNNYFADPQDVLSSTTVPWVQLYEVAEGEIPSINNTAQAVTVLNDVQSHLSAARTLLIKDPTLVKKEKDAIHTSEAEKINSLYQKRLVDLGLAQPTVAMAGNPVPTIPRLQLTPKGEAEPGLRTHLKTVDPAEDALHVESLQKLGVGTKMKPTSKF